MKKLRIGLFGYGKMGKMIENLASTQNCEVVWAINRSNRADFSDQKLREADVVIEFSRPESAFENVKKCLEIGLPVVCGTTGWLENLTEAKNICTEKKGAFLWASNFSIGVNIFFEINRKLAEIMQKQPAFAPSMLEIHHIHKLDAPSGTAVSLAEDINFYSKKFEKWSKNRHENALFIESVRENEVPGTHKIFWKSAVDTIEISHEAHSREGFALGALVAAQWIFGKNGNFEMRDVLRDEMI